MSGYLRLLGPSVVTACVLGGWAGTTPLDVLYPAVERELAKQQAPAAPTFNGLDANAYQNFAITDDAVIFFFDENRLIQDDNGPHKVSVPRADLASLMAV